MWIVLVLWAARFSCERSPPNFYTLIGGCNGLGIFAVEQFFRSMPTLLNDTSGAHGLISRFFCATTRRFLSHSLTGLSSRCRVSSTYCPIHASTNSCLFSFGMRCMNGRIIVFTQALRRSTLGNSRSSTRNSADPEYPERSCRNTHVTR